MRRGPSIHSVNDSGAIGIDTGIGADMKVSDSTHLLMNHHPTSMSVADPDPELEPEPEIEMDNGTEARIDGSSSYVDSDSVRISAKESVNLSPSANVPPSDH